MPAEQSLQDAAQAMVAAAENGRSVVSVLKRLCPHIYQQIRRDARYPELLSLWGRSVNVDENVGQIIVHPAILSAIGSLAGVPVRGRVVHAGLQHTYGYLFSLIETPYGAKRDRWLSTDMERGFGIDLTLLGDRPSSGTLLANLTWFVGQIVFRDRPRLRQQLEANASAVAPSLLRYDYARLAVCRIMEKVVLPGKPGREVSLITDLLRHPHRPADMTKDDTLLVYSIQQGKKPTLKLITAFPVRPATVRELRASVGPGKVQVRPRYNAYVRGFPPAALPGHHFLADSCS
jgi:hypothetical protein